MLIYLLLSLVLFFFYFIFNVYKEDITRYKSADRITLKLIKKNNKNFNNNYLKIKDNKMYKLYKDFNNKLTDIIDFNK